MTAVPTGRLDTRQMGFTIPEVLVASALGLVVLATVYTFNRFQLFALRNQAVQLDIQTAARGFVDLFAREVRGTGMDPTCSKAFDGMGEARSDRLRIRMDLNGNGVIDGNNEDVTYVFNAVTNSVERTANGATETLFSGLALTGSSIRYFDANGTELVPTGSPAALTPAQRALVRRVRVHIALQGAGVDPQNTQSLTARASTDVDLRNRFFIASTACP
jgi:prepilin-type N-terminal cleavage/methylation domain-containing protein